MKLSTVDQLFGYDAEKSEQGVPEIVGVNSKGEDVVFYVAEAGNEKHEKVQRRYSKMLEATRKVDKEHEKVISRIIAESILVSWEGMLDEKENLVEPTVENKTAYLIKYRKLRQKVMEIATNDSNFMPDTGKTKSEIAKDTEKN